MGTLFRTASVFLLLLPLCQACPNALCICEPNIRNQLIINCRSKTFQEVPTWTPSNDEYAELTLGNNQISTLKNNAFSGLKINKLDLSRNRITTIEEDAFKGLDDTLYELVLHTSMMTTLPQAALQKLPNLRILTLKNFNIPMLPANPFSYFTKLHTLKMDECGLTSLKASDFNGVVNLETLSLPNNQFQSIPTQALTVLGNLKILNITYTLGFGNIPYGAFASNTKLEHLDLSGNGLTNIVANAFLGLESSLRRLVLQENDLTDNQMSFISGLRALEQLDLANNKLTTFPTPLIQTLSMLQNLYLNNNKITKLLRTSLNLPNSSLKVLNLAENEMVEIEERSFEKLLNLEELNLERQSSSDILKPNTLKGLENSLRTLLIQNNGLTEDHFPSVNYLRGLRHLYMGVNRISSIPDQIFAQMNNLRVLNLHQNRISILDHTKTPGLAQNLEVFDISSNYLQTVGECTFYGFNQLENIELTGNPLNCDCKLRWLYTWMENKYVPVIRNSLEWKCSSPERLRDRRFSTLLYSDLDCTGAYTPLDCSSVVIIPTNPPDGLSSFKIKNVTDITESSFTVIWHNPNISIVTGFSVDLTRPDQPEKGSTVETLSKASTKYTATHLESDTNYVIGITILVDKNSGEKGRRYIQDVRTSKPKVAPVSDENPTLKIILGSIFGVLAVILIIVIVCVACYCSRKKDEEDPYSRPGQFRRQNKLASHGSLPTVSGTTQRFSRSKTASMGTLQSAQSLDRLDFTPEERDRILNMLTNSGGTTMSMISNTSGPYVGPALPPRPPHLHQEYANSEIKGGPVYEEIGSDV